MSMWAGKVTAPSTINWFESKAPEAAKLNLGEVIIKPRFGGICGSDLTTFAEARNFAGEAPPHGAPLHEIVGTILHSRDSSLEVGQTVVGWAGQSNALAQLVLTHGDDVAVVSDMDHAHAVVAQPLACAFAALERLPVTFDGAHVAVLGLGPIGLLFADVLKDGGASHVTGVDPVRRVASPENYGVDTYIEDTAESWSRSLSEDDRPSIVLEVVGHQRETLGAALEAVAPGGTVFYFGIPEAGDYPIDMVKMLRKGLTLQSGVTPRDERRRHLESALAYLARKPQLAPSLITEIIPLFQAQDAYDTAVEQRPMHAKILIDFESGETAP